MQTSQTDAPPNEAQQGGNLRFMVFSLITGVVVVVAAVLLGLTL